ncbi:MAG: hypothetical protein JRI68_14935 [Deltaproteobacteria bacterium]|nr:hypothetical protein [Deltaproteobacteria bacterium]
MAEMNLGVRPAGTESALPSQAGRANLAHAQQAIRHVQQHVTPRMLHRRRQPQLDVDREQFSQWLIGRLEQIWMVVPESEIPAEPIDEWPTTALVHRLARAAEQSRAGHSGDHALIAFAFLLQRGVRPLHYMHAVGREHAFVVIGRKAPERHVERVELGDDQLGGLLVSPTEPESEIKPESWGADAAICDPWSGVAYRQPELINSEYYHDYFPAEAQLHAPLMQDPAFEG